MTVIGNIKHPCMRNYDTSSRHKCIEKGKAASLPSVASVCTAQEAEPGARGQLLIWTRCYIWIYRKVEIMKAVSILSVQEEMGPGRSRGTAGYRPVDDTRQKRG